jgi:hypothetical protein
MWWTQPWIKKIGLYLACALVAFGVGFYCATKIMKSDTPQDKTVTSEKKHTTKHTTTKIVTKPDGTVEQTTEDKTETDETSSSSHSVKPKPADKYRIGAFGDAKISDLLEPSGYGYGISAGMRVLGPVWLDTQYNIKKKDLSLGASIQF